MQNYSWFGSTNFWYNFPTPLDTSRVKFSPTLIHISVTTSQPYLIWWGFFLRTNIGVSDCTYTAHWFYKRHVNLIVSSPASSFLCHPFQTNLSWFSKESHVICVPTPYMFSKRIPKNLNPLLAQDNSTSDPRAMMNATRRLWRTR